MSMGTLGTNLLRRHSQRIGALPYHAGTVCRSLLTRELGDNACVGICDLGPYRRYQSTKQFCRSQSWSSVGHHLAREREPHEQMSRKQLTDVR